jgi:peptide/nickel transport system permease protein
MSGLDQAGEPLAGGLLEDTAALSLAGQASGRPGVLRAAWASPRTKAGAALGGAVVLLAIIGPFVAPHSPYAFITAPFAPPSGAAPLGGDTLGRDVVSRVLDGGFRILIVGLISTVLGVGAGTLLGALAVSGRSWLDETIMRPLDVVMSFPQLVLALLLVSVLGPKVWLITLTIALVHVPHVARTTRAAALDVRHRDFIAYSESLGTRRARLVAFEILPNVSSIVLVELGLRLTYSIVLVAGLSFLGFGFQPPTPDWGLMINENRVGMLTQPWGVVVPVILIAILTIGVNLVTDGVARAAAGVGSRP